MSKEFDEWFESKKLDIIADYDSCYSKSCDDGFIWSDFKDEFKEVFEAGQESIENKLYNGIRKIVGGMTFSNCEDLINFLNYLKEARDEVRNYNQKV